MGDPFAGFPSLYPQLPAYQTLSSRLSPNFAPQLAGNRCLTGGAASALWPDQRHVQLVWDAPRTRLVVPLLALSLPTSRSS
jgi:hypothetical protein